MSVGDAPARQHSSCISKYFQSVFSAENEVGEHSPNWETPVCESDDEGDSEDCEDCEDEVERELMAS